jgi:hypothetical protein
VTGVNAHARLIWWEHLQTVGQNVWLTQIVPWTKHALIENARILVLVSVESMPTAE